MRKQARRLWFGDWQRDEERTPEQGDTVIITPDDDGYVRPPVWQRRNVQRAVAVGAAVAVLFVLALGLFSGSERKPVAAEQAPPAQVPQSQPQVPPTQVPPTQVPPGSGGPDLTGTEAAKAAKAALAKYPGDIERVTAGPAGRWFVVHVIQADGNEVHVIVDDQFKVRGSDANSGPRNNFGPGTPQ